jgi:hypothetical protein
MNTIARRALFTMLLTGLGLGCGSTPVKQSGGLTTIPTAGSSAIGAGVAGTAAISGSAGSNSLSAGAGVGVAGVGSVGRGASGIGATSGASGIGSVAGAAGSANPSGAGTGAAGTAGMLAAAAGGGAGAAGSTSTAGFPQLPRVTTTDGPGPFTTMVKVKNTPPGGWLIYPKDIGKDGIKHPIFLFGPGGGTTPDTYETMGMHWDRYGSYGFVIYVIAMSTGDGAPMKAGLDWVIKQNDDMTSPLYQHLDTSKVAAAGHSEGSVTVFAFMPDDRVTTTVHISGGSFDGKGPSKLKNDTMFMCANDASGDPAKPQCDGDFKNSTVRTFYTVVGGGATHITSARTGWPATIAWLLWHLAGQEDQWKKEFLEPTGKFQMGIYTSQIKNF